MAADNTRKTSNVIHDLANLKTQVDKNTNNIANATSPNDGKINLSVGTGLSIADGSSNASANQAGNTSWTVNLDPTNITLTQYLKNVDGVGPNASGGVDLKSTDSSLNITPDATNNSIDLTLNGTIPTVNDKTIGLVQGTGINISGANATTNMAANSSQCISLNANISDLNDVNTSGASINQTLVYNGTQWLPGTVSGSGNGTVKSVDGVGPNTTTGDIDLSSPNGSLTITPDTANNTVQLEANLATLNSSLSSTLPFVKIDGTSKMTGNLQTPGIKGTQTRDANADPNNPISFTDVIEGGTDGSDPSDDYTQWLCSGHIYMGYTGSDPDTQTYRIKNLQEPVDDHDAATKQYVDGKTANIPTNVVNKLNTKTGEITIKSDDSNTIGVDTSDQNITLNLSANLGQLKDVNSTAASPNQVLTWDDNAKEWKPAASQTGGVTELSALNDTNVDDPETGEILVYDKSTGKWNNQSPGENTAELPISSSDETVKLSDDTTGGQTSNFIVETGTDVFKLVANASVFGTDTNPNGGPEVISIVGDGWGGIIVGDSVTGNRIPDGTVVVSKDENNLRVTLSQATTGDTLSTEELTFSRPAPAAAQFQERMRIDGIGQITAETPGYDDNVEAKSLVTKAWVEANSGGGVSNLPISSSDNKVTLSDDDNGQFQISTGADEASKTARVYVEADGKFGVGKVPATRFMVGDIDDSEFFYGSGFAYVRHESDNQSGLFLINNNAEGNAKRGIWGIALEDGSKNDNSLYIYNSGVSGVGTDPRFEFTAGSTNNFIIKQGQLQTDTITTKDGAANDIITYLANDELRVNTAIEKPSAPGTYGRSNTFTVEPNAVKVLSNINTGDADLAPADLVIGYPSTVGSATPFGLLQWQAWDNTADKNMISFCEIGIDPVDGAGRGNGGELVFKTKEANIDGTTERLRITTNDIKAQAGYEPQTDDSLVTKGWVTTNAAVGSFLPLAGGTFDMAAHVFMPAGNTVTPQLQVGCQEDLTSTTQGANFAFIVSGNKNEAAGNKNAIFTVWSPNDTGIAYMKWAINEDATEYWNVLANSISTAPGSEGNRFWQVQSGEGGAFITCVDSTDSSQRQVTINQTYLCTPRLGTVARAEGDAELRMMNSSMVAVAGDDLGNDPETGDPLGFSELANKVLLGSYKYKANNSDEGKVRYASLSTRNGSFSAMPTTVSNQNTVAIDIYEQQNNADSCMSIQWNAAAGAFNAPSAEIKNVRQGSGANFHLTFSAMAAGELKEYLTLGANQILASETYEPTEDNALVTKGFLTSGNSGAVLPIKAPDGFAEIDADDRQMQVGYTNTSDQEVTPNTNDVFYVCSNGGSREISTVAIFQSQSAKPKRGLHIINDNGNTTRTNGRTIIEQRANDTAGPLGNNPNGTVGKFELNVDGWQHIGMAKGCVVVGEEGTHYSTVKLNLSGSLVANTQFPFYIETRIQGADSTYDPETGTGSFRSTYVVCSTPRVEADIDDLYHFRCYYSSSQQPTKTVRRSEFGFYVDDRLTQSCPKRVGVYSAIAARNDADRNISVRGAAPSEFVGPVQVNNIREYNGATNGVQALFSGATCTLYQQDADLEFGHFVYNTANGHIATGIKGGYTPGTATVTFRKHLEDSASNTQMVRCDPPVFGYVPKDEDGNPLPPEAISKFGVCVYPDNRGDLVSFVGFDFSKYNNQTIFPDDPQKEFVDVKGFQVSNVWDKATGKVSAFYSGLNASATNSQTWQVCAAGNAPSYFAGPIQYSDADLATEDAHLVTKKYVDSRIWKGTQSEYDALSTYDDEILYCITG